MRVGHRPKSKLKKIGEIVGISSLLFSVTIAATYTGIELSKKDQVSGKLDEDLSSEITDENGEIRDPISEIDPNAGKYEDPSAGEEIDDDQVHDELGENDPNKDPFGSLVIE